jgi:hypothetical protein
MASREEQAEINLRRALRDAGVVFALVGVRRETDGYVAVFRWGPGQHVESGIDEAVLEDAPPTEAMTRLIRKVESLLRPA